MDTREEIRNALFTKAEPDLVVELSGLPQIHLRRLDLAQQFDLREASQDSDGSFSVRNFQLAMLILSAHDGQGTQVFDRIDRDRLLHADGPTMEELLQKCLEHNRISGKAQGDVAKASGTTGAAALSSGSASDSDDSPEKFSEDTPTD